MEGYGNENPGAFQSTRPLRGATLTGMTFREMFGISTHAPLAGRDCAGGQHWHQGLQISTHAPLAGRDGAMWRRWTMAELFQPTRPLRGATGTAQECRELAAFQPTRPLRGATTSGKTPSKPPRNFNPRAPCGARLESSGIVGSKTRFQPTRPLRGATYLWHLSRTEQEFQPTRPLRGATVF